MLEHGGVGQALRGCNGISRYVLKVQCCVLVKVSGDGFNDLIEDMDTWSSLASMVVEKQEANKDPRPDTELNEVVL